MIKKLEAIKLSIKYLIQHKSKFNLWAIKFVLTSKLADKYCQHGVSAFNGRRWFSLNILN